MTADKYEFMNRAQLKAECRRLEFVLVQELEFMKNECDFRQGDPFSNRFLTRRQLLFDTLGEPSMADIDRILKK